MLVALALSCLAVPRLAVPCLASPRLASPCLALLGLSQSDIVASLSFSPRPTPFVQHEGESVISLHVYSRIVKAVLDKMGVDKLYGLSADHNVCKY